MERIDQDLDLHAEKKKLLRLVDEQFLAGQTPDLPKLQFQLRELKLDEIELEIGRPRTEAYVVYVFLMLRGWVGAIPVVLSLPSWPGPCEDKAMSGPPPADYIELGAFALWTPQPDS